jgi:hypothetical protein
MGPCEILNVPVNNKTGKLLMTVFDRIFHNMEKPILVWNAFLPMISNIYILAFNYVQTPKLVTNDRVKCS